VPESHRRRDELVYRQVGPRNLRLDVYLPHGTRPPFPTVLYLHGGGWTGGAKEEAVEAVGRLIDAGWAIVSPEYRVAPRDPAPAAVEDAVCSMRWLARHAAVYGFDLRRLLVAGYSAGGHLALLLAFLPDSLSFGNNCVGEPTPRPTAVLNLAGVTDVGQLLEGPWRRDWAEAWAGVRPGRPDLASTLSPLTWIRPGVPPVVTVQGEADTVVPYAQAVRLHQALSEAGVPNRLCTARTEGHDLLGATETEAVTAAVARALVERSESSRSSAIQAVC